MSNSGTKLYQYDCDWHQLYADDFNKAEKETIVQSLEAAVAAEAYGIKKLREICGIDLEEMIFAGYVLFPGGNDYPVKEGGVVSIQVNNAEETKRVIETFLATSAGI